MGRVCVIPSCLFRYFMAAVSRKIIEINGLFYCRRNLMLMYFVLHRQPLGAVHCGVR